MIRRALTTAALALLAFGAAAPLAQAAAAPKPVSFTHQQAKFSGTYTLTCPQGANCVNQLKGTLSTTGGATDCYQIQWQHGAWYKLTETPICGQQNSPVDWVKELYPLAPQISAFRLCRVGGDGSVHSCGAAAPVS